MEPSEQVTEKEHKIKDLEQDLNDLRQGLAVVRDFYKDLESNTKTQVASLELDEAIVKPLMEDELEFESIWSFHEEVLEADPSSHVPCTAMYKAFVEFCTRSGRSVMAQEAFEFVFEHMENPKPACDRGNWIGYRLRVAKE
ncbi:MAG: hypothetical protein WCJ47_03060 [Methanomicrobiales archaeon]